jgi:gamma-glutamyltranspeptidase
VTQIAINLIDHQRTVQEAVDAPRLRQTVTDGQTRRELGFSDAVIEALMSLDHTFRAPEVLGSVQAVVIDRNKRQFGAADKRRIGGVVSVLLDEIEP